MDHQTPIQRRQCGHKLMYADIQQARDAAKAMHKRHKAGFTAYHCPWCNAYHVGTVRSKDAAERRSARRGTA